MARRRRAEEPGAGYYVTNRCVARRTIFDSRADFCCMKLLPGYAELAASTVASCAAELYSDECESPGSDRPEL